MMFALILLASLFVTDPPVAWEFQAIANGTEEVKIKITAQIDEGWHVYATDLPSDEGPLPTVFRFEESTDFRLMGDLIEPAPVEQFDPNFAVMVKHHSGKPEFTMKLERTTAEAFTVKGEVEYMACNDRTCLPPLVVPFEITIDALK